MHYLLPEGNEMVEEYDTNNGQLLGNIPFSTFAVMKLI